MKIQVEASLCRHLSASGQNRTSREQSRNSNPAGRGAMLGGVVELILAFLPEGTLTSLMMCVASQNKER